MEVIVKLENNSLHSHENITFSPHWQENKIFVNMDIQFLWE